MAKTEIIMKVGAEGGDLKILGRRTRDGGWEFSSGMVDQSLMLIDEGEPVKRQSRWVEKLSDALAELDRYPWAKLYPLVLHPEFRAEVLAEVRKRLEQLPGDMDARTLERWEHCESA